MRLYVRRRVGPKKLKMNYTVTYFLQYYGRVTSGEEGGFYDDL